MPYKIPMPFAWPILLPNVTERSDGMMSSTDKTNLDLLIAGGGSALVANVVSFGAKGDGVTDDTAAIQAAIDFLRDVGGIVYFPATAAFYAIRNPGLKLISTAQHSYNNIVLVGTGYASCIKTLEPIGQNNGTGNLAMIWFQGLTDFSMTGVGVRNLRVSGFDRSTLAGPLILYSHTTGGFLANSWLDTSSTEGAYWNSPTSDTNGICVNNHATLIGGYGVAPPDGPLSAYNVNTDNALILNNYADSCGLAVEAVGSGIIVQGNFFSNIAEGVALTPSTALSIESTFPGTRCLISGNVIRSCGLVLSMSSITSTEGDHLVADNVFQNVDAVCSIVNNAPVAFRANIIYDTFSPGVGSAALFDHAAASTAPLIIEGNTITGGPTGTWAYAVLLRDAVIPDIVRDNTVIGAGFNAAVFSTFDTSTGWNAQFIDNIVTPLTMGDSFPRYHWQGVAYNKSAYAGIDNGTVLSTLRPAQVRAAAAPVTGVWNVGDVTLNTAPGAGGVFQWVCTAAGPPAVWTALTLN